MTYPADDTQFSDQKITKVEKNAEGTFTIECGGWMLWCGKDCPIEPRVGQMARQYGRGIGSTVRGLFIDGAKIWYRTEAEDKEHFLVETYGANATDWLNRWDAGKGVWSIEMGGLGPGYEQCIQIMGAEILRHLLNGGDLKSAECLHEISPVKEIGCSGAQWGAACNLASNLFKRGPVAAFTDEAVKDRKIQVSRDFPQGKAA